MYHRSPELLHTSDSVLLIIDVQEKLMPHITNGEVVISNVARLIEAATILNVPVVATEQYPKGLGPTDTKVNERLQASCFEKMTFSCLGDDSARSRLAELERPKVLLAGVESQGMLLAVGEKEPLALLQPNQQGLRKLGATRAMLILQFTTKAI